MPSIRELAAIELFAPTPTDVPSVAVEQMQLRRALAMVAEHIEDKLYTTTAAYTVTDETVILANATGGAFTVTLPLESESPNRRVTVKRLNSGANNVTVAASTGTIDGAATIALTAQYMTRTLTCDGTNWHITGAYL